MLLLKLAVFAHQSVILRVRNFGAVAVVIGAVVARDELRQLHQPIGRVRLANHASIAAIFVTLFILRAVPSLTAGSLSRVLPIPSP